MQKLGDMSKVTDIERGRNRVKCRGLGSRVWALGELVQEHCSQAPTLQTLHLWVWVLSRVSDLRSWDPVL